MSQGNASAAIGLANTNKIPTIGVYVQDQTLPGPAAEGEYIGVQAATIWSYNWLGEDPGFLVPSTSGVASGKNAQWVTSGASPITVPADGRMTITGGTAVAASGTGLYKSFIPATTVIPAGSFFWAFEI
jgi:hypothetical protein